MPVKPSEKEEEYFARQELERGKKMQEEEHRTLAEEEKKRLREFHYMPCSKCAMELSEPMMLRKQIVAALLVPTLVFEETVGLYQESFKTGVDVQVGCR